MNLATLCEPALRGVLLAAGAVYAALAAGLATQAGWAVALWPWPDTRLSHLFVASVCGALAAGALWSGGTGRVRAAAGSLRGLVAIYGSVGIYLAARAAGGEAGVLAAAGVSLATALAALGLLAALRALPPASRPAIPLEGLVRISTGVFALALTLAGAALVARVPGVFPWPLAPQSSTVFGLVFLGLALVYADVAWTGSREAAVVAMAGFLVYDLILLPPFLARFAAVPAEFLTSLTVYTAVLVYSAALALWFLPRAMGPG